MGMLAKTHPTCALRLAVFETRDAAGDPTSAVPPDLFHHIQPVCAITDTQPDQCDDAL